MQTSLLSYDDCFIDALAVPAGVTALVGSGGKTSLMFRLASELSRRHKVIVATTTHVMRPDAMPVLADPGIDEIKDALRLSNAVFVGRVSSHDKMTASGIEAKHLAALADFVLIEADGAKGRPLKAPAFYEPVIPEDTRLVIAVAGLDGLGRPIEEAAHRPALFASVLGVDAAHVITPADLARMLSSDDGQHRGVTKDMRYIVVLNKADTPERVEAGRQTAAALDAQIVEAALITSFNKEASVC